MRARLLASLLVLTACVSTPAVVPEPRASAETPSVEPPREPRCVAPRYALVGGDPSTALPLDEAPALDHDMFIPVFEGDLDGDGKHDAIVNLGICGNWGECIHVVFLGCGGGVFSLASEPDHYAFGFSVEPSAEGLPTPWELVRGELQEADRVTRLRWEVRDGRAARASADTADNSKSSAPARPGGASE